MGKRAKSIAGKEMQKLVKFAKALDKMNEEWLHELGDEVLTEAKDLAPMGSTGGLYLSHKIEYTEDGFKIVADTPYAYALHEGKKQEAQKRGVYKSKVKAHWRNVGGIKWGTISKEWQPGVTETYEGPVQERVKVRAHTKKYKKGYKPTLMPDGNWATINLNKKPKKKAWLQEAWKIVRRRQDPVTRKLLQKSLYIAP